MAARGCSLLVFSALVMVCADTARAADNFICEAGEDEAPIAVIIDEKTGKGSFSGLGLKLGIERDRGGDWINTDAAIVFLADRQPPLVTAGFRQFSCVKAAGDAATARRGGTAVEQPGRSLGGNLRTGPGTGHARMKPLRRGTSLVILSNTRVSHRGYDWFRVKLANGRTGFQWGGILCSEGKKTAGLKSECGAKAAPAAKAGTIFQVFAIGPQGRYGHGSGEARDGAEAAALRYCGSSQCSVQDVTTRKCHAVAHAGEITFFGAAKDTGRAAKAAFSACKKTGAGNCQVTYVRCR